MSEQVDLKVIEQKLADGKSLTPAELKEVMSIPPDGESNQILAPEDDIPEEDYHLEDNKDDDDDDPKPAGESAKKATPAAKEGQSKATPKTEDDADEGQSMDRINQELDKEDGKEDLTDLTKREKALFWEMRRLRRRTQQAELERDNLKRDKMRASKAAPKEEVVEEEEDPFKGRDPEDKISVKEFQELLKKAKTKKPGIKDTEMARPVFDPESPVVTSLLKAHEREAKTELGADFDETVELTEEIISDNPVYLQRLADAMIKGENVAKLAYTLIKGDPAYTKLLPIAQARLKSKGKKTTADQEEEEEDPKSPKSKTEKTDSKTVLEKQKKLEDNAKKPKTSAHGSGGSDAPAMIDDYTVDQLVNMTDAQYSRVPKKVRDRFMKEYGS